MFPTGTAAAASPRMARWRSLGAAPRCSFRGSERSAVDLEDVPPTMPVDTFTALGSRYLTTREGTMNAFYEHHHDSIRFGYRCFDRILLNGLIQPFQQPERVVGFFNAYRDHQLVSRDTLRDVANQFHNWVKNRAHAW